MGLSRYFSHFSDKKIMAGKGPTPKADGGKKLSIPESTAGWKIQGTDSYNPNKGANFPKVKQSVKTSI